MKKITLLAINMLFISFLSLAQEEVMTNVKTQLKEGNSKDSGQKSIHHPFSGSPSQERYQFIPFFRKQSMVDSSFVLPAKNVSVERPAWFPRR